jgi:CHASE2 domain-containing sensor protein
VQSGEPDRAGGPAPEAPYVGLSYYSEEDARIFFGRDSERKKIIGNLRTSRLTLLYAGSGVGKSSLLRAGVASRLRELATDDGVPGRPTRYVPVVYSSWADDPLEGLIAAIRTTVATYAIDGADVTVPSSGLEEAVAAASSGIDATLLIILDQFEEYFLYRSRESAFADELAQCINHRHVRAHFLIAIRDDAYARVGDLFKGRIANVYGNYLQLGHLERDAARAAIQKPLERLRDVSGPHHHVDIEPALVEAVLDQVRAGQVTLTSDGGNLGYGADDGAGGDEIETPYLQLVMKRLWQAEVDADSSMLRLATLEQLGGAVAIVKTHLDAALNDLSDNERELAAGVFHYLITPSRTKIAHDVPSLAEYTGRSPAEVGALLEKLSRGETRIVRHVPPPPGQDGPPRFEVFHDVLAEPILDWRARQAAQRVERERRRLELRAGRLTTALAGVIAIVVALLIYIIQPGALQRLELKTIDRRFDVRGSATPTDLVIVGLDKATFATLADPATGSVPRATQARAIDEISRGRPAVIGEDIIYDTARPDDAALFAAIRRARGHIVLGTDRVNEAGDTTLFGQDPATSQGGRAFAARLGAQPAFVGAVPDSDGRLRHFQSSVGLDVPGAKRMATLPVVAARLAGKRIGDFGSAWIDYRGTPGTISRVSFLDVVRGRIPAERFRNKIVLVGATAPGVDAHPTPAGGGSTMPGVEILANAAWTASRGLPLHRARGADFAAIVLMGLVPLLALVLRPALAVLVCLLAAAVFVAIAQLAFNNDLIVSIVYPLISLVLSALAVFGAQALQRAVAARRPSV